MSVPDQHGGKVVRIVGKMCNLFRVSKTDISAVFMVESGLDPHMINKLEYGLNYESCLWLYASTLCFQFFCCGLLYTYTQVLTTLDQLTFFYCSKPFLIIGLSCHIISALTVRPGATGLLKGIECSRVRDSAWMYLTSNVTTRTTVGLVDV